MSRDPTGTDVENEAPPFAPSADLNAKAIGGAWTVWESDILITLPKNKPAASAKSLALVLAYLKAAALASVWSCFLSKISNVTESILIPFTWDKASTKVPTFCPLESKFLIVTVKDWVALWPTT